MTVIYKSGNRYYLGILLSKPNSENPNLAYMTNESSWGFGKFKPKFTAVRVISDNIINLDNIDEIITEIESDKNSKIDELKKSLKSTNRSDYSDSLEKEYIRLKELVLKNAERMVKEIEFDDESFENRLKEICKLKKELFAIPCDEAREARKYNGTIKYKIRQIEIEYDRQMELLSFDNWNRLMN